MTKYTNKKNIHPGLFAALAHDHYYDPSDKPSDYSATGILNPIQQTVLKKVHAKDLPKRDILDNYHSWVGSVLHEAVERAVRGDKNSTAIVERRFYGEFCGKILSGKIDYLDGDTITDLKSCKVYKILANDFSQWEAQANIYRLLAEGEGFNIKHLQVETMIMDWTQLEADIGVNTGYPQTPIHTVPLQLWSLRKTREWIEQRITWLEEAKELEDESLADVFPCSMADQWSRFEGVKLFKKGAKRATKVFKGEIGEAMDEAEQYVIDNEKFQTDEYYLEEVFGKKTRCESYCDVSKVCHQRMRELGIDPNNKPLF